MEKRRSTPPPIVRQPYRIRQEDRSRLRALPPRPRPAAIPPPPASLRATSPPEQLPAEPSIAPSPEVLTPPEASAAPQDQKPAMVSTMQASTKRFIAAVSDQASATYRRITHRSYSRRHLMFGGLGCFILGLAVVICLQISQTNHNPKAKVAALSQPAATNAKDVQNVPSEVPGASCDTYDAPPTLPQCLEIPRLGVRTVIRSLGMDTHNQLEVPSNIYEAGWYSASAAPGGSSENGATLIDGHAHGPTKPGIFVNLKSLQPGDIITITRGNHQTLTYSVKWVVDYGNAPLDMSKGLTSIETGRPGLNLISADDSYDSATQQYGDRTLVQAVQQ